MNSQLGTEWAVAVQQYEQQSRPEVGTEGAIPHAVDDFFDRQRDPRSVAWNNAYGSLIPEALVAHEANRDVQRNREGFGGLPKRGSSPIKHRDLLVGYLAENREDGPKLAGSSKRVESYQICRDDSRPGEQRSCCWKAAG